MSLLSEAQASVGRVSGTTVRAWYNTTVGNIGNYAWAWCAAFVCWAMQRAYGWHWATASCGTMIRKAQAKGWWHAGATGIQPGDIVFFDWDDGVTDHVGVCEQGMVFIEGNGSSPITVTRETRRANQITGYIHIPGAESAQAAPDIDALARRVRLGNFGDGDERKAALGDLFDRVQARVGMLEEKRRVDALTMRRMGDHIDTLESHIRDDLGPPPPPRPEGI